MKAALIGALMALLCLWHETEALPPKFGNRPLNSSIVLLTALSVVNYLSI